MTDRTTMERGSSLLWFGLLGGALAWSLHLLLSYGLAESACATALGRLELFGMSGLTVLLLGVSLLTALLALAAALASLRNWWRWRGSAEGGDAGYVGLSGLLLSGAFLFIIVVESLPFLLLPPCA